MSALDHPLKDAIELLRQVIRGADGSIAEGIQWEVPSFRTTEYFAATDLRAADGVGIVFHLGARAREDPMLEIADPDRLLEWLARDRAMVRFSGVDKIQARKAELRKLVREWIR